MSNQLLEILSADPSFYEGSDIDLFQKDEKERTLLHHAAEQGKTKWIEDLLKRKPSMINQPDKWGYRPLHCAFIGSYAEEVVPYLLRPDVDLIGLNQQGESPIHHALRVNKIALAQRLRQYLFSQLGLDRYPDQKQLLVNAYEDLYAVALKRPALSQEENQNEGHLVEHISNLLDVPQMKNFAFLKDWFFSEKELKARAYRGAMNKVIEANKSFESLTGIELSFRELSLFESLLENQIQRILIRYRQEVFQAYDSFPVLDRVFEKEDLSLLEFPAQGTVLDLDSIRQKMKKHRNNLLLGLKNGKKTSLLLEENAAFFKQLTIFLFRIALLFSTQRRPCEYAFLILGSLSQNEMAPYSDIEFALLIERIEEWEFFQKAIDFFSLLVIGLNEPSGYHLDEGGCPFTSDRSCPELIQTPEGMAALQLSMNEGKAITRHVLRHASLLTGSLKKADLFERYKLHLSNTLNRTLTLKDGKIKSTIGQLEAVSLMKNALQENSPKSMQGKRFSPLHQNNSALFEFKPEFYVFPRHILMALALWYGIGIEVQGSFKRIEQLEKNKIFSPKEAFEFIRLMDYVLRLRFKLHLYYEKEHEWVYHPEFKPENPQEKCRQLTKEEMIKLKDLYRFLIFLEVKIHAYSEENKMFDFFTKKINFIPPVPAPDSAEAKYFQAREYERFFEPQQALTSYQAAQNLEPGNMEIRLYYQAFLAKKIQDLQNDPNRGGIQEEDYEMLGRNNLLETLSILLEKDPQVFRYINVYRRLHPFFQKQLLEPAFQQTFIEHFQETRKKLPRERRFFIQQIFTAFHELPDETGQRENLKSQKGRWEHLLRSLVIPNQVGDESTVNLVSPILSSGANSTKGFVLQSKIKDELLDEKGNFRKTLINKALHNVVKIAVEGSNLYVKAYPEMPGMTYLIENLHHRLIGHGTCFSELVKLERPGKPPIPLLISPEIPGPTLDIVFREYPERLRYLDRCKFSQLAWLAMLTNPEDGLPTNYIFQENEGKGPTLTSIDHDHALFPAFAEEVQDLRKTLRPVLESGKFDKEALALNKKAEIKLQVKTILFCLDLMQEPMDPEARELFLQLDLSGILMELLKTAQLQNNYYSMLFDEKTIQGFHEIQKKNLFQPFRIGREHCTIPIPLKAGDAILIYKKMVKLRHFIHHYPQATLLQCLFQCEPRVGLAYAKAFEDYANPLDRLLKLGEYPLNEQGQLVTRSHAMQTLRIYTHPLKKQSELYAELKDLTPAQGLSELTTMMQEEKDLNQIRREVQRGEFNRFNSMTTPHLKALVISGSFDRLGEQLKWEELTPIQQEQLLTNLKEVPFERLILRKCLALNLESLLILLEQSPDLIELEISEYFNFDDRNNPDSWFAQIISYIRNIKKLVLCKLHPLFQIENLKSTFPYLEHLIISDNPNLERFSIDAPQLKFLQAKNNPRLVSIQTKSENLREADLRNNPCLTHQALELNLALPQGLLKLRRLQLENTAIKETETLESYPMLLLEKAGSKKYFKTQALLQKYLAPKWQEQLISEEENARISLALKAAFESKLMKVDVYTHPRLLAEQFRQDKNPKRMQKVVFLFKEGKVEERARYLDFFQALSTYPDDTIRQEIAKGLEWLYPLNQTKEEQEAFLNLFRSLLADPALNVVAEITTTIINLYRNCSENKNIQNMLYWLIELISDSTEQTGLKQNLTIKVEKVHQFITSKIEPNKQAEPNNQDDPHDELDRLKQSASAAIGQLYLFLSPTDKKVCCESIKGFLKNPNKKVRLAVIYVLPKIYEYGEFYERNFVLSLFEETFCLDKSKKVRHLSKLALMKIYPLAREKGKERIDALLAKLSTDNPEREFQDAAEDRLEQLCLTFFERSSSEGPDVKELQPEERGCYLALIQALTMPKQIQSPGISIAVLSQVYPFFSPEEQNVCSAYFKLLIKNSNPEVRCGLAITLGELHPLFLEAKRKEGLELLKQLAGDRESVVRVAAIQGLSHLYASSTPQERDLILKLLKNLIQNREPSVREAIATAIGQFCAFTQNEERKICLGFLQQLVLDEDSNVRQITAKSIGYLSKTEALVNDEKIIRLIFLTDLATDRDRYVRAIASGEIGELSDFNSPKDRRALIKISEQLAYHKDKYVRAAAARGIGGLFKIALPEEKTLCLNLLTTLARDKESTSVRRSAAQALGQISHTGQEIRTCMELLKELVRDQKAGFIRSDAAKSLGELAAHATNSLLKSECLVFLEPLVQDKEAEVRATVAMVISKLFQTFELFYYRERLKCLNYIKILSEDVDSSVRRTSARGLAEMFKHAGETGQNMCLKYLQHLIYDQDIKVRSEAIVSLGELGTSELPLDKSLEILNLMSKASTDLNPEIRKAVAQGLFYWIQGGKAALILQKLTVLLNNLIQDKEKEVYLAAQNTLVELQIRYSMESVLKEIASKFSSKVDSGPSSPVQKSQIITPPSSPRNWDDSRQIYLERFQNAHQKFKKQLECHLQTIPSDLHPFQHTQVANYRALFYHYQKEALLLLRQFQVKAHLKIQGIETNPSLLGELWANYQAAQRGLSQRMKFEFDENIQTYLKEMEKKTGGNVTDVFKKLQNTVLEEYQTMQEEIRLLKQDFLLDWSRFRVNEQIGLYPSLIRALKRLFFSLIWIDLFPVSLDKIEKIFFILGKKSFLLPNITIMDEESSVYKKEANSIFIEVLSILDKGIEVVVTDWISTHSRLLQEQSPESIELWVGELLSKGIIALWQKTPQLKDLFNTLRDLPPIPIISSFPLLELPRFPLSPPPVEKLLIPFEPLQQVYFYEEGKSFWAGYAVGSGSNNCFIHALDQIKNNNRVMKNFSAEEEKRYQVQANRWRAELSIPEKQCFEIPQEGPLPLQTQKIIRFFAINVAVYTQINSNEILFVRNVIGVAPKPNQSKPIHGAIANTGNGHYVPLWPVSSLDLQSYPAQDGNPQFLSSVYRGDDPPSPRPSSSVSSQSLVSKPT